MKKKLSYILKKSDSNIKVNINNNKQNNILIKNKKHTIELNFNTKILKKTEINFFLKKLKNSFKNLSNQWCVELLLKGIGYKSFYMDKKLILDLGYSNLITYEIPENVFVWNLKTKLFFYSFDKNLLNNIVFQIKKYSLPEVYTGKGVLLKNEIIKIKSKAIR